MSDTTLLKLEANIDNMNPEWYGSLLDKLLKAGANDAWLTPIIMKKGRPAIMLSVLAKPALRAAMERLIFENTTTIGLRYTSYERAVCDRGFRTVNVEGQMIRVKEAYFEGKLVNYALEYEDLQRASLALKKPIKVLSHEAMGEYLKAHEQ